MLKLGNMEFKSRLIIGSGKFSDQALMPAVIEASGAQMVTLALRRVDLEAGSDNILEYIPKDLTLLPNTSGATNAEEAIRIARLARTMGCGDFIKIEVINDTKYLLPDNEETIKATKVLAEEGFIVLPYMNPDLIAARKLQEAGAAAVMPLGSPIGSNRGIQTKEMIRIIIEEIDVPVIIDAGIGRPSEACEAMEMGADAVMVNTAIASSDCPEIMAKAFRQAVEAGRSAFEAKLGPKSSSAVASSPLTGFLGA
ncbi:thiazole synthase [Fusibacter sp. A1]|nr:MULTISPECIES: thiazole synthase [unclassified Fusibacter]MCK8059932.1 thiazole synthase [Fusibacter sp. A2]NPE22074.1 thiazole synthase [Fusibacter sp. A1]RXV60853.1 thiazole synthase [Fusibacter sp. A1]